MIFPTCSRTLLDGKLFTFGPFLAHLTALAARCTPGFWFLWAAHMAPCMGPFILVGLLVSRVGAEHKPEWV